MLYLAAGGAIGVLGVAFGVTCYYRLWKFARQCQHARIVVAYKQKVKLNAPLLEWLLWVNMLDRDKDAHGRMLYSVGGTSVSIIKKSFVERSPLHELVGWIARRGRFDKTWGWQSTGKPVGPQTKDSVRAQSGRWTQKDETVKQ
jgi:hypothetical protein